MDDEAGGLFNIAISDSETEDASTTKAARTGQSEADYQAVKKSYHAKVENGEVYKNVSFPLEEGSNSKKQLIQEVLHAAEELYYFRRYEEAVAFIDRALAEESGGQEAYHDETRTLLVTYRQRCEQKLANKKS